MAKENVKMAITFPPYPIPVTTPLGDGVILYIKENNVFENDEITVVLNDGGIIRHFLSDMVKVWNNETYSIKKK